MTYINEELVKRNRDKRILLFERIIKKGKVSEEIKDKFRERIVKEKDKLKKERVR